MAGRSPSLRAANFPLQHELVWGGASMLALVPVVLLLRENRAGIDQGTAALILLAAPLLAAQASLRVALLMSVLSALTYNYWFAKPYGSLIIHSLSGTIAFVVYFAIGVLVAFMVSRLRSHAGQQALKETDRLRVALMQSVTHDLRTPLTSITALASAFPELGALSREQTEVLRDIQQQSARLTRLVDQVLDMSRIEGGALRLRLASVPLEELVHAAAEAVEASTGEQIEVTLDDSLPVRPIDEALLGQVLINLLENAIRYGAAPFEVRTRLRDSDLELQVIDHGTGVPADERDALFDPAFAMSRPSPDSRSRGLGLVISAGFVAAHGGRIEVADTPGGGATFSVVLPAGDAAVAQ